MGTVVQRIDHPHARYYIGEGKAKELAGVVRSSKADLVIFDEDLSPAQGKGLEDLLEVRVMDRSELILDIFATRARSKESRMQVELAQLEYLLPRLRRMWSHLSRIRGGIGLRGPGETQLETDRRLIGKRIGELKRKLGDVAKARAVQRKGREGHFRVALVGYTNAGKSSLLQALSGSDMFVEDRLFATLDPATRVVDLGSGHEALMTDTVGFIRKLPHDLVASFRSTLDEALEASLLLFVVDASDPAYESQLEVSRSVLKEIGADVIPSRLILNKIDRVPEADRAALIEKHPDAIVVSAKSPQDVAMLRETLIAFFEAAMVDDELVLPYAKQSLLGEIYDNARVLSEEYDAEGRILKVRGLPGAIARLRSALA